MWPADAHLSNRTWLWCHGTECKPPNLCIPRAMSGTVDCNRCCVTERLLTRLYAKWILDKLCWCCARWVIIWFMSCAHPSFSSSRCYYECAFFAVQLDHCGCFQLYDRHVHGSRTWHVACLLQYLQSILTHNVAKRFGVPISLYGETIKSMRNRWW